MPGGTIIRLDLPESRKHGPPCRPSRAILHRQRAPGCAAVLETSFTDFRNRAGHLVSPATVVASRRRWLNLITGEPLTELAAPCRESFFPLPPIDRVDVHFLDRSRVDAAYVHAESVGVRTRHIEGLAAAGAAEQ